MRVSRSTHQRSDNPHLERLTISDPQPRSDSYPKTAMRQNFFFPTQTKSPFVTAIS